MSNSKAFTYCIRLLAQRDYSKYKLRKKLVEREFDSDEIESTIDKLVEYKYLQEDEYIRVKIKSYLEKGYGHSYIIQKLKQEELYITAQDILPIENEYSLTSESNLERLIEKKLRYKTIPEEFEAKMKLKRKIEYFLHSKGHASDAIKNAMHQFFS